MADVRALLKAKREEARISHPLATYDKAGLLKCAACGTSVKHASAWEGHLGSKLHRTNVVRLKEEENVRAAVQLSKSTTDSRGQITTGKRKALDKVAEPEVAAESKKRKVSGGENPVFPKDFFSDGSRNEMSVESGEEDEDDPALQQPPFAGKLSSAIDLEYEQFQRELMDPIPAPKYEHATIVAEPHLIPATSPQGLPADPNAEILVPDEHLIEEDIKKRKEVEERELIMDRIVDEERAQEEADMKVSVMKTKLEALKKKRATRVTKS